MPVNLMYDFNMPEDLDMHDRMAFAILYHHLGDMVASGIIKPGNRIHATRGKYEQDWTITAESIRVIRTLKGPSNV